MEFGDVKMSIRQATLSEMNIVRSISKITISEIYPHYYSKGAVDFFLEHHCETNVIDDIKLNRVFLCLDKKQNSIGTVTIKGNEICRLFVLPQYQGHGYGTEMLDYAEKNIARQYAKIILASSLPAKRLYLKRGYKESEFNTIPTGNHDFLCYDVMIKEV